MGYTNFLREDWLHRILSWQSKSVYGCFLKSPQFPRDVITSDVGFNLKATKAEVEQLYESKEKCQPHFTATSLLALSVYYDFLMDSENYWYGWLSTCVWPKYFLNVKYLFIDNSEHFLKLFEVLILLIYSIYNFSWSYLCLILQYNKCLFYFALLAILI